MNKRRRDIAVFSILIILIGLSAATIPPERLLYYREYTPLEYYPTYYYANFNVRGLDINAELSLFIEIDFDGNYTTCGTLFILYKLPLAQFEEIFNVTEAFDTMKTENWNFDEQGAIWAGGVIGSIHSPIWSSVPAGDYVLVFWFDNDELTAGWSATLAISLRTRLLQLP